MAPQQTSACYADGKAYRWYWSNGKIIEKIPLTARYTLEMKLRNNQQSTRANERFTREGQK